MFLGYIPSWPPRGLLLCLALVLLSFAPLFAESAIPDSAWEQHPEGIALALSYKGRYLTALIKNTSHVYKQLGDYDDGKDYPADTFAIFFYVDSHGTQHRLGNHRFYNDARDDEGERLGGIAPNTEFSAYTTITSDELTLMKAHPVLCNLVLYDPATKERHTIKSSPRMLMLQP